MVPSAAGMVPLKPLLLKSSPYKLEGRVFTTSGNELINDMFLADLQGGGSARARLTTTLLAALDRGQLKHFAKGFGIRRRDRTSTTVQVLSLSTTGCRQGCCPGRHTSGWAAIAAPWPGQ